MKKLNLTRREALLALGSMGAASLLAACGGKQDQPAADAPLMDPADFSLVLVPCCTAARDGRRLGFGGGFYDRYLLKTNAVRAVLCRERVMCDDIPINSHDLTMDIVISERGVIRI